MEHDQMAIHGWSMFRVACQRSPSIRPTPLIYCAVRRRVESGKDAGANDGHRAPTPPRPCTLELCASIRRILRLSIAELGRATTTLLQLAKASLSQRTVVQLGALYVPILL